MKSPSPTLAKLWPALCSTKLAHHRRLASGACHERGVGTLALRAIGLEADRPPGWPRTQPLHRVLGVVRCATIDDEASIGAISREPRSSARAPVRVRELRQQLDAVHAGQRGNVAHRRRGLCHSGHEHASARTKQLALSFTRGGARREYKARACSPLVGYGEVNQQRLEQPLPKPRTDHSTQTRSLRSRSRVDWAVEAARRVRGELVVTALQVDGLRGGAGAPTDAGGERPTC